MQQQQSIDEFPDTHYNTKDQNMPHNRPTRLMIALPVTNEEMFQKIYTKNKDWFGAPTVNGDHIKKHVTTMEDYKYLQENIVAPILHDKTRENNRGEVMYTENFPPKPTEMKIVDYIDSFVKSKGVSNHYTFVLTKCIRIVARIINAEKDIVEDIFIVPLYVRLKQGKTLDQMKSIEYNPDGSYTLVTPPRRWFVRDGVGTTTGGGG
jgi:hypothetical protein